MSSYYYAKKREAEPTGRELRDAVLKEKVMEVWKDRQRLAFGEVGEALEVLDGDLAVVGGDDSEGPQFA